MEIELTHPAFYGLAVAVIFVLYVLKHVLSFLTNPLGSVPGPFYTRITSYVFHRKIFSGARFYYVHALHQKYGPVVRIAPDEVSVADLASVKRIHGIGTPFTKTDWYKNRTNLTAPALFTEKDPHLHAQYRRLLANAMSETSLTTSGFEEMIKTKVDRWNEKVQTDLKAQGWSDFLQWDTFLSTDTIGELTFGSSFDTLKIGKKTQFSIDMDKSQSTRNILGHFPSIRRIARYLPFGVLKDISELERRLAEYAVQSIQRHRNSVAADPHETKPTLFSKLYALNDKHAVTAMDADSKEDHQARADSNVGGRLTDERLAAEARSYITAGTDTTASTLTFLFFELARHPAIQTRLSAEMNALPADYGSKELRNASVLDAVVSETLRLCGAAMSGLPRAVPPGGATFCGYYVPRGATVSTQSYSLHRDGSIFTDPDRFDPDRWNSPTPAMKDAWQPFSIGSRSCIGKNLALLEIRLAVAALFRARPAGLEVAYGASGTDDAGPTSGRREPKGMSEEDMDLMDYFVTRPKGQQCLLRGKVG